MLAPLRCALGDYTRGDVMTDCSDQNHSETSVGQGTQYLICARCWGERKKYSVCNWMGVKSLKVKFKKEYDAVFQLVSKWHM